jgi:hypothetical protein
MLFLSIVLQKIYTGFGIGFVDLMVILRARFSTPIAAR